MKKPTKKRRPNLLKLKISRRKMSPRRKLRRPNPAYPAVGMFPPSEAPIMEDPIFMHHVASAIFRAMEIRHPDALIKALEEPDDIDAEFTEEGDETE